MNRTARAALLGTLALAAVGVWMWRSASTPEERAIRDRFQQFAGEFNAATTDGLGTVARAARIGQFFTDDIVVELGQGSPPIQGRETLIGMATRLQPRTAAFVLEFEDIIIDLFDPTHAEVAFTMVIRRRTATGEEALDAREFSVEMRKTSDGWQVNRAVAIDTLR